MLDQYILDIDGIKKFFSNMDNVVKCVDRSESDVIIEICNDLGYDVYSRHNPNGCYHGVYCLHGVDIMFTKNGADKWASGIPFKEWMGTYARENNINIDLMEFV